MPPVLALFATAPRWLLVASAAAVSVATHGAAYHLGAAHEFRAGFAAGKRATIAQHRAATQRNKARQIEDRLNAEILLSPLADPDGMRCGPSTRDCAE